MEPKPFWRLRNILLLALGVPLLTFCVWSAWAVHWAFNAQPGSAEDYTAKMQELGAARQAADQAQPNGWKDLATLLEDASQVARQFVDAPPANKAAPEGWPEDYGWPPSPELCRIADAPPIVMAMSREMVEAYRAKGVFATLDAMREQRRFERPIPQVKLIEILLPELGQARNLARASVARMRLAHLDGNDDEAAAAFEGMMTLSRATGRQTTLIDQLVSVAIRALAMEELRNQLGERPPAPEALARMLAALNAMAQDPSSRIYLEGERLFAMDTIQWTHTDDGKGNGRFIPAAAQSLMSINGGATPMATSPIGNLAGFVLPSKKETTRIFNEYYDLVIADAALRPAARTFNADAWIAALPKTQILARVLVPAIDKASRSYDIDFTIQSGTRAMLALELFKARHDAYPERLDQLVPEFLPVLPIDPWNPGGLIYRRDANAPRGYVLYSCGIDAADNSATFDTSFNLNALNKGQGTGKDYNFLEDREKKK